MFHRLMTCTLLLIIAGNAAHAQSSAVSAARTARLIALARLDAAVHYFHPAVATSDTPWDSLFAAHVVAAADAPTSREYRQHVATMLAGLGDALTTVPASPRSEGWRFEMRNGVAHVRSDAAARSGALNAHAPANRILLDLRGATSAPDSALLSSLLGGTFAPTQYALLYNGLPALTMRSSGGYGITWRRVDSTSATPDQPTSRVVVIADSASVLPAVLLDGMLNGRVRVVGAGTRTVAIDGRTYDVDLGEGLRARVRTTKLERFSLVVPVDTIVTPTSAEGVAAASLSANELQPRAANAIAGRLAGIGAVQPSRRMPAAASSAFPSTGYRILAAARVWNTFDLFSPYKHRFTKPWAGVLAKNLLAVENASNELAFHLAVAAIVKETNDGHSNLVSNVLNGRFFKGMMSPLQTRFVENKLVVSRIGGPIRDTTSVRIGDEIVSVDGESIDSLVARYSPYLASSTPQGLRDVLATRLIGGVAGAPMTLELRGSDQTLRTVKLVRPTMYDPTQAPARGGPIIRMLGDSIGYVDMERLPPALVDSVFRMLSKARAVIFDMRGYPQGTGFQIGPRLTSSMTPVAVAHFDRPVRPSPDSLSHTVFPFDQTFPVTTRTRFTGRTVMLIDERAVSQSEHTGLIFHAMTGTTFVGTPTVGANGDVTDVPLPGALRFYMTGQSVKFPDGTHLQGVGLTPDVHVAPTIRGMRAGEDEVLTAGYQHLGGRGTIHVIEDKYVPPAPPPPIRALPGEETPEGWTRQAPPGYRIGVDTTVVGPSTGPAGNGSLHITYAGGATTFVAVFQLVSANEYRGKRITLSGYIKTRDVPTTGQQGAGMFMRVDRQDGEVILDNMMQRLMKGTSDWTRVTVTLDVPADAMGIQLGAIVGGAGEAWLDDLSISIVDATTPVTAQPTGSKLSESDAATMRERYAAAPKAVVNGEFRLRSGR